MFSIDLEGTCDSHQMEPFNFKPKVVNGRLESGERRTWEQSFNYARNLGKRLPTLGEIRDMVAEKANNCEWIKEDYPNGTQRGSLVDGEQWVPIVGELESRKDWA